MAQRFRFHPRDKKMKNGDAIMKDGPNRPARPPRMPLREFLRGMVACVRHPLALRPSPWALRKGDLPSMKLRVAFPFLTGMETNPAFRYAIRLGRARWLAFKLIVITTVGLTVWEIACRSRGSLFPISIDYILPVYISAYALVLTDQALLAHSLFGVPGVFRTDLHLIPLAADELADGLIASAASADKGIWILVWGSLGYPLFWIHRGDFLFSLTWLVANFGLASNMGGIRLPFVLTLIDSMHDPKYPMPRSSPAYMKRLVFTKSLGFPLVAALWCIVLGAAVTAFIGASPSPLSGPLVAIVGFGMVAVWLWDVSLSRETLDGLPKLRALLIRQIQLRRRSFNENEPARSLNPNDIPDISWDSLIPSPPRVEHPGANLEGNDFSSAHLQKADFNGAKLARAKFESARLMEATLRLADLTEASMGGSELTGADLSGATMRGAKLARACLITANLERVEAEGADFTEANLTGARLTGANLAGAKFTKALLAHAKLEGASLRGADFSGADFKSARLTGADLRGANLTGARNLTDDQLRDALTQEDPAA